MERSKSIFFFIIFLVIIAITIAFSKALPSKNEKNQETEDFIDTEEELDANSSPQDIETGFIEEPPIMLDETTARHLSNFRYKAGKLAKDYPDTFFTSLPTKERVVALTFDDGPDNVATPKVLDILDRYDITATFFS